MSSAAGSGQARARLAPAQVYMRWMPCALAPALGIAVVRSLRMGYGADIGASGWVSARTKSVVTTRPRKAARPGARLRLELDQGVGPGGFGLRLRAVRQNRCQSAPRRRRASVLGRCHARIGDPASGDDRHRETVGEGAPARTSGKAAAPPGGHQRPRCPRASAPVRLRRRRLPSPMGFGECRCAGKPQGLFGRLRPSAPRVSACAAHRCHEHARRGHALKQGCRHLSTSQTTDGWKLRTRRQ